MPKLFVTLRDSYWDICTFLFLELFVQIHKGSSFAGCHICILLIRDRETHGTIKTPGFFPLTFELKDMEVECWKNLCQ